MITIDPNHDAAAYIRGRMATDRALTPEQAKAVKSFINEHFKDATPEELVDILCLPIVRDNPDPQGTISQVMQLSDEMQVLIDIGKVEKSDFTKEIPDPDWQPTITGPSPMEQMGFHVGDILSIRDIEGLK